MIYERDSKKPIYISTSVFRALWLLAKADKERPTSEEDRVTPDSMADAMIRDQIEENYPQLFEHQKQIDKLEKELIKTL